MSKATFPFKWMTPKPLSTTRPAIASRRRNRIRRDEARLRGIQDRKNGTVTIVHRVPGRKPVALALAGQRFGRLLAECATTARLHGNIVWKCRCDCGNEAHVLAARLVSGNTSSCGCLRSANGKITGSKNLWRGRK